MNTNYKNLPIIKERLKDELDFNKVFKKYNNFQFFIIVINNIYFDRTVEFYYDDSNKKVYFELSMEAFKKFSNDELFKDKIKQISQNYYQILTQQSPTTIESNTSSNELIAELKLKLEKINSNLLSQIRVFKHKKKDNKHINFMINDLIIYTPNELKDSILELLQSLQSNNQEQNTSNQNENNIQNNETELSKIETISNYPIFQKNYKDSQKNFIKEILKTIPINKLQNLKLYEFDSNKKDKFNNSMKTNFKNYKTKPTLYYQKTDLPIIKQFLKQTKQGYSVKSCQQNRKKIIFNNILFTLSNKNKIILNNNEYYINLNGKKYYQLALIDNINPENNKRIIINHQDELSKSQKNQIQQTYQKLKNEKNIESKFHTMYDLLLKFTEKS